MLTPRVLTNPTQAAVYFEVDDYYVQGLQVAPSSWWGRGAKALGLTGEVDRDTFAELLAGRLPNGVEIKKGGKGTRRPGLDLTFSAPKSVSIAALVADNNGILRAHERAVTTALDYLEKNAPRARSRKNRRLRIERSDNLVVARFNHESSRALDPQLHTHAVVLNVTRRRDDQWKALLNDEIFRSIKTAGAVYRAELAHHLQGLGYAIERTHADGRFEIQGIGKDVIDAFSQRRAEILEHLEEKGLEGPEAARVAARATRDRKQNVRRSILQDEWRKRTGELGADLSDLRRTPKRRVPGQHRAAAEQALDHAIAHLTERKVVASERRIIAAALGIGIGKTRLGDLSQALKRRIASGDLVSAVSSRQKDPFAKHYTTDQALAIEQDLIHMMKRSRESAAPIVGPEQLEHAMKNVQAATPFPLTPGQERAIRLGLSTSDKLVGIQGYAGTGKTTGALLHIRRIAEHAGFEVRGFAPSAAAAEVLTRDAGIESITLARLLREHRSRDRKGPPKLWIVDEVSMMDNETAQALLQRATHENARLIWVGDKDQLPAVGAGRPFALLMENGLQVAKIDTIVRQKDEHLRCAVEKTIQRDHRGALEQMAPRIVAIPDRKERLRAVAQAYLASADGSAQTIMVTPANTDRRALNNLVRRGLHAKGILRGRHITANVLVSKNITRAQMRDPALYEVGDIVRFGRNRKNLGITVGDHRTITAVDLRSNTITLRDDFGAPVDWRPTAADQIEIYEQQRRQLACGDRIRWTRNDYGLNRHNGETAEILSVDHESHQARVAFRGLVQVMELNAHVHWDHAYASTVHAAQGQTADRVLLHLDTSHGELVGHESWYVGISRGRSDVRIFTDDEGRLPAAITLGLNQESALEVARTSPARVNAIELQLTL